VNPNTSVKLARDAAAMADSELELVLVETLPPAASPWAVPAYIFDMRHRPTAQRAGRISLRRGVTENILKYAGHIGYAVNEPFRGHHFAERACRLILPLVRAYGTTELWITCGPDNPASQRTIERLGAQFVEVVDVPPEYPLTEGVIRKKCRYRLAV
jgi:tagatose 1,6-diphosphate aldolase